MRASLSPLNDGTGRTDVWLQWTDAQGAARSGWLLTTDHRHALRITRAVNAPQSGRSFPAVLAAVEGRQHRG